MFKEFDKFFLKLRPIVCDNLIDESIAEDQIFQDKLGYGFGTSLLQSFSTYFDRSSLVIRMYWDPLAFGMYIISKWTLENIVVEIEMVTGM